MATGRAPRSLVAKRRRWGDDEDGEDEEPVIVEDSQSEGSVISDDGDEQVDESSVDGIAPSDTVAVQPTDQANKTSRRSRKSKRGGKRENGKTDDIKESKTSFPAVTDTHAMLHGMRIDDFEPTGKAVDFNEIAEPDHGLALIDDSSTSASARPLHESTAGERQRKEHEEYRRKRDSDPSFTPNRGTFFMHDTRGQQNGQSGPLLRGAWQSRGRGRGRMIQSGGPVVPANITGQPETVAEQPWKHDLHDTINEEPVHATGGYQRLASQGQGRPFDSVNHLTHNQMQPRVISFSTTKLLGKVQIRVNLPGMSKPAVFSDVQWNHYTRLPNHRPPLRRDKPVRISIPPSFQRFIFPSPERSFIFIPRQLRPNQQGYNRNSYQRTAGGYGYSSRRTSMYGGSMYSASVAASRRSSVAGMSRADAFSPVPFTGPHMSYGRPIVRLPYGSQSLSSMGTPPGPLSDRHTPVGAPMLHTYPLPQQPTFQGTPTTTMHQPRPQKTISVTGIESPAVLQQTQQGPELQPFQSQLPAHIHEQTEYSQTPTAYFSPRQQYGYAQSQMDSSATGQPFAAHPQFGAAPYFAPYPAQPHYYYPGYPPTGYNAMPVYVPGAAGHTPNHAAQPSSNTSQAGAVAQETDVDTQNRSQSRSGMVAHESNGMVFYMPASEAQSAPQGETYQPAESFVPSYAMPGLPPPTPAPENMYYYPTMPMPGMQPQPYYPHPGQ